MKRLLSVIAAMLLIQPACAQITITAADMPVAGDTLRYSIASPVGAAISPGDSGTNVAWNYPLTSIAQAVDTYKTASQVNLLYVITVGLTAFGYKVADTLPGVGGLLPVSINDIYTFFEEQASPARFEAKAFAANISGIPTAANYTTPDVWYFFPLTYANYDSSAYALDVALPTLGALKESGYRKTRVDGWGTIVTPYYTTPVNCIRVRSQITEIDSISFGAFSFGFPRNTVEYKWLVNGGHFPALWVTSNVVGGTETISSIQYRDAARNGAPGNAASNITRTVTSLKAYPNPAYNGLVTLGLPAGWDIFVADVFDMQSKSVASFKNQREINIASLPAGQYMVRITCGKETAYIAVAR